MLALPSPLLYLDGLRDVVRVQGRLRAPLSQLLLVVTVFTDTVVVSRGGLKGGVPPAFLVKSEPLYYCCS